METKAFSMQSPEAIAKQYGGNKQKIAQAMQLGIIDPTAGTLAGMFIDRMRAAAQAEQAPQQTVAQQVFAPPAPPQQQMPQQQQMPPQAPPQAGLGATPPAGQAPPMGMAAGGMVAFADGGGLPSLQVPDDMFNSSLGNSGDDQQYADGGIVSFAAGSPGMLDLYDDVEQQESGGNQNAVSPAGARGVMQLMPGTMKDPGFGVPTMAELRARGLSEEAANRLVGQKYLEAMYKKYGNKTTALMAYNWGPDNTDKWLASGADPKKVPSETRNYVKSVMGGNAAPASAPASAPATGGTRVPTLANYVEPDLTKDLESDAVAGMAFYDKYAPQTRKAADMLTKEADRLSDPATVKKQERDDKWMALAEFGFKLAGSNSPYFLQAVGEAANATLPGMKADKKEREARRLDAIKMYAQAEGITNEMASKRVTAGMSYAKDKLEIKDRSIARVADIAKAAANDATQIEVANINRESALDVAKENVRGQIDASEKLSNAERLKLQAQLAKIPQQATENVDARLKSNAAYQKLTGKDGPELQQKRNEFRAQEIAVEQARLVAALQALIGPTSGDIDFAELDKTKAK
jgi:hypothetical protein